MTNPSRRWLRPLAASLSSLLALAGCTHLRPAPAPPSIQERIDTAHAAGGGVVRLEAGVHEIDDTLLLRSGVHLRGAGAGATVIRPTRNDLRGKVELGAGVNAVIGMVGVEDVSLRGFTLDLATAGVLDNGIAILPEGERYDGKVSRNVTVRDVTVRARLTHHSYMIWNLRGEQIRILDNTVDGGRASGAEGTHQEGIESYGGSDVLIAGNVVRNVGYACYNIGSAGGRDTASAGIILSRNWANNCIVGFNIGSALDPEFGAQDATSILVSENMIEHSADSGIRIKANLGTTIQGVVARGNIIEHSGRKDGDGAGIYVQGTPYAEGAPRSLIVLQDNFIRAVRSHHAHGIRVIEQDGVDVRGNRISDVDHSGIFLLHAPMATVTNNRVDDVGYSAIAVHGTSANARVTGNTGSRWARLKPVAPVLMDPAQNGVTQDNFFYCHAAAAGADAEGGFEAPVPACVGVSP